MKAKFAARFFASMSAAAVILSVSPVTVRAQAVTSKPIVAIEKMDDLANSGQAPAFSTMIQSAIESTNKFRVIERARLDKLVGEQARARSGLVTSRKPGKVGGFEGADYLIYGSITTLSMVRKSDFGSSLLSGMLSNNSGGKTCSGGQATLSIDIKITDADSGEVRYNRRIDETQKLATTCDTQNPSVDAAALLRSAADKVATGLVTAIYPIQIAAVQSDGVIVLNYGEGAVRVGDMMSIFTKGEVIRDPATGEIIANDEQRLGGLRITDVLGRVSKAQPVGSFSSSPTVGAIVRPATAEEVRLMNAKPKKK